MFTTVIPSKIFENASMQIPILMGVEGEAKDIISQYGAGLCFRPEDQDDFLNKLNHLLNDSDCYQKCKEGCARLAADFDRRVLAKKMLKVIEDVVSDK